MGILSQFTRVALVAGLAPAAAFSCNVTAESADCEGVCDTIEACGLLPSSLGMETDSASAHRNCVERCALSDDRTRAEVEHCAKDVKRDWCEEQDSCRAFASCLEARFPNQEVTGRVRIAVVAVDESNLESNDHCPRSTTPRDPSTTEFQPFNEESAADRCTDGAFSRGRAVVIDASGALFGEDTTCVDLLVKPTHLEGVRPGVVEYGLELRGVDANNAQFCAYFRGGRPLITAEHPVTLAVAVPEEHGGTSQPESGGAAPAEECGGRPESCSDGSDNDGDGNVDCADPKCACPEAPASEAATDGAE